MCSFVINPKLKPLTGWGQIASYQASKCSSSSARGPPGARLSDFGGEARYQSRTLGLLAGGLGREGVRSASNRRSDSLGSASPTGRPDAPLGRPASTACGVSGVSGAGANYGLGEGEGFPGCARWGEGRSWRCRGSRGLQGAPRPAGTH